MRPGKKHSARTPTHSPWQLDSTTLPPNNTQLTTLHSTSSTSVSLFPPSLPPLCFLFLSFSSFSFPPHVVPPGLFFLPHGTLPHNHFSKSPLMCSSGTPHSLVFVSFTRFFTLTDLAKNSTTFLSLPARPFFPLLPDFYLSLFLEHSALRRVTVTRRKGEKLEKLERRGGKRTRTIEPCFSLFRARRLVSPRTQGEGERGRTIGITPRVFARRDDVCGEGSGTCVPSKTKENSRRA